ncbi:MAG TPA: amino acid adenylation domain-containing protein, partial [Actinomycetota bacterium]|nr:amino acid adenylation domain-containing protein [Actinomycetota bacterium]
MSSQGPARERLLKALLEKKGIVRSAGGIPKAERSGPLQLSFAQQRLWFLEKLVPFGATYNIFGAVLIDGKVSFDTLERSLRALVARHESLRTGFVEVGEEPRQVIRDQVEFFVGKHDLSLASEADAREKLVDLARELARKPFDLTRPPLLRVAVVEMPGDKQALLICMHHIVSDGWSMGVFIGELSALYEADGADTLPPLEIQYPDFAEWQRGWLESEQVKSSLSFWRDNLGGAPSLLELPTDRPRPTVQTYSGATYFMTTDQAVVTRVDQTARDLGATPFMVLFACFATLLHRYTGADDIVVGSPIAGRSKPETEPLIGFFVNALPLRVSAAGDPSFEFLVARTKESVIAALEHQDVPFERIVEEVRPERDMGHPPLFQVTFALQNAPMPDLKLGSAEIGYLPVDTGATKFDLSLDIELDEGAFSCSFNYNTDMFDPKTIEQMAKHFENLLRAATSNPSTPISALEILDADEANAIGAMYTKTEAEYPRDKTLHEQFEAVARQYPDRVAVSDQGLNTNYGDLDRKSQELALRIRAAGAEGGSPVGIFMERGEPMIVSIVAVMKSGCACLPLDVTYPGERLSFMVQDSGATVIVTDSKHAGKAPDVGTLVLVDDDGAGHPTPAQPHPAKVRATDPAYVMFTSGSTGVPKGILLPHRAVTSRVINANYAQVSEGEVVAQVANASFDVAIWEVWAALLNAGRLAILPKETVLDPPQFKKSLIQERVAYLFLTSTLFNQTVSEDPSIFETLDTVILGGEVADPGSVSKVLAASPPKRVMNIYGPTECTTYATYHVVTEVPEDRGIPIGLPISNATVFILDKYLNLVPRGVTGEICLGGDGVAIGYLNRPELTKEKFVETPFGRLYRTGDLGRINSEGLLEFAARVDEQLKIRGVRIEPAEVETAITSHEGVDKAVVLGIKDRHGEKMLAAYYAGSQPPSPADLKTHLMKKLPPLFIPQALMPLDRIPLTPNGKADKRALPDIEISGKGETTAPATEIEKKIARIFESLLGAVSPGLEDDFFDLGGHSLLATRLVSHIAADAGAQIPLKAVFEDPTVGGLAGRTEAALKGGRVAGGNPIVPVERSDVVEASFAQQRLWFFDQFEPASSVYNVPMILRLKGSLDQGALRRSLHEVMRRHEILRTTFEARGGRAVQVIANQMPVNLQVVDLSGVDPSLVESEAERAATDEAQRPFDLARGPLLRTTAIKLSERDHLVVFATHHIVSDGWSLGILVGELSSIYDAFRRGLPSPLPEPHLQHADYSLWQKNWLDDREQQAPLIEFWRDYMHGATEVLEIPGDKPRPPVQTFDGDTVSFTIDPATTDRIKKFCAERNITMFMALLAVFKVMLSRYSGVSDVVVATPIAGRTRAEMEGLIGFFVNTLVLRTDLSGNPTVGGLMERVRESSLGAFGHQEFPFEKLVEEIKPPRELAHSPVFQVVFSLQNVFVPPKKFGDLDVSLGDADTETAKFDLTLDFMEVDGALDGSLNFNTNIFERQTAERMTGHYLTLLEAALSSPDLSVDRLPMMTPEEERLVKSLYLTERKSFEDETTIASRFFRWARETPNAAALKHGDETFTYSALSAMAELLAGALHEQGVGPESVVPILCERGPEMVAAMLAVLCCGAAYAPLDPSYPVERLQFIVSDTRSELIVAGAGMDSLAEQIAEGKSVISADGRGVPRPPAVTSPSNLAYVIYTSGSTGTPKGVGVTHHNVTRLFDSTEDLFGFSGSDVWSVFHSFSFDFSVWELWGALTTGGSAVIVPKDAQRDPKQFLELVERERVTVLNQTPSAFYRLSEAEERSAEDADLALRLVIFGGEALDFFRLGSWIRRRGDREPELFNMYGITETTVHVSHRRVTEADIGVQSSLIGRPLSDLQMLVLDRQGGLCPIGVAGEIHVGGDGIARGYLNRPALTAERFVANEFTAGERLYRSGDLGRMTSDGDVQYLGRGDDQLKIRGFRIEPGEIGAALRNHPDV